MSFLMMFAQPTEGSAADGAAAAGDAASGEAPGEASNGAMDQANGLIDKITSGEFDQITGSEIWSVAQPVVLAIVLLIVVLFVAGIVRRMTIKAATKAKVEVTLAKFFGQLARWAILIVGIVVILGTLGIEVTSFAAILAALGFAVGMALSGTLGNVAAGIMLLIFRPYKVGDVISVNGVTAKVDEIGLFTTTFDTPDMRRIIMPNSSIFGSTIENISHHPRRRVDVSVGTDYSADLDKTRDVLMGAARAVQGRLTDEEPVAYLSELGGSSIDWSVRVWVNAPDFWAVRDQLTRDVKMALDNAGIGIPFPQMDVHMDKVN